MRLLRTAVAERRLERLLLSKYQGSSDIERLTVRLIELRGEPALSFLWRHATKDITRNHSLEEGVVEVGQLLGEMFGQANLDTPTQEVQLRFSRKGKPLLHVARKLPQEAGEHPLKPETVAPRAAAPSLASEASQTLEAVHSPQAANVDAIAAGHDRQKPRALSLSSPFWRELGVTHEVKGRVDLVPAMARKWKQINKFIEIFAAALRHAGLTEAGTLVRLADFGSGKGYLTFAMHDYLRSAGLAPEVEGVELRPDMVSLGNVAVQRHHLQGLRFAQGDVRERDDMRLEVMVALHACDIATDYAMHVGLRSDARIIMCAPCCHKEVRPQMRTPAALRPLLQHGIHLGQEAEMVTDSVRALLLELMGYDTQVIEFIALEHTSKNKMVLAVKRPHGVSASRKAELVQQLQEIKQFYGLRQQTLETLLIQDGHLQAA
jgi:Methyltransferase domain